ncbi:MAG TPA: hypothetical protein VK484_08955 [Ferruginibacter sp.]|nr:hypothetical protein [Ferruginibacter sp.]
MKFEIPNWLIILGGIGQMFTAIIYPYIRHVVFDWYNDIKKLNPLNQEIAKTYGRYIQGLNFAFGLISILFTGDLKNETGLAVALTGLIAAYWTGKVITQFAYYPMYEIPKKKIFKIGEVLMNTMFVAFSLIFILMFVFNLMGYLSNS